MGWNAAFAKIEKEIIESFDKGTLTKETLDTIVSPYMGTDCDSGGSNHLVSKEGYCVEHIICLIMKPDETKYVIEHPKWDGNYEDIGVLCYNDDTYPEPYWTANMNAYDLFCSIWYDMWGMW